MTVKRYIITADDVVDNLTSTDTTVPLSAKQGNVLAGRVSTVEGKTANATTSTAGIVKIGSGISVSSGTISVPNATTSSKGIVQVGSGLSVSNGVISVSGGGGKTYTLTASTTNLILSISVQWGNGSGYVPIIGPTPNILYNGTISLKLENSSAQGTAYFVDSSGAVSTQSLSTSWKTCTLPSNTISIGVYAKYITGVSAGCTGLYT